LNGTFQTIFRIFYGTALSDLTFGFRIFKREWVKTIAWEELRHPFLLEYPRKIAGRKMATR
jgi:hypothetical protein